MVSRYLWRPMIGKSAGSVPALFPIYGVFPSENWL